VHFLLLFQVDLSISMDFLGFKQKTSMESDLKMDSSSSGTRTRSQSPNSNRGGKREGSGRKNKADSDLDAIAQTSPARSTRKIILDQKTKYLDEHDSLLGEKGRSMVYEEARMALAYIIGMQVHFNESETNSINTTAKLLGKAKQTLWELLNYWKEHKEVLVVSNENRNAKASGNKHYPNQLKSSHIATIHGTIVFQNESGEGCTSKHIRDALEKEHQLYIGERRMIRILHKLGYNYGKSKWIGNMNRKDMLKRNTVFMKAFAKDLVMEDAGSHIIVYMDESYIHKNLSRNYTWFNPDSPQTNEVNKTPSKGERLIIVHAMSIFGLLTEYDNDNYPVPATNDFKDVVNNCELVFEGTYADADYHKNMNQDVFCGWLRNRLIPTFKHLYPNKKCILILDNAGYHHARGGEYVNPNQMNKNELILSLGSFNIESIEVQRNGQTVTMNKHTFYKRGGHSAPKNVELKSALQNYLNNHPEFQTERAEKIFKEDGGDGWYLIFTPPYNSECQPIEKLWAYVKGYVARNYYNGRNLETTRNQTLDGFYGNDDNKHKGVDHEFCDKLINLTIKYCNAFILENIPGICSLDDLKNEALARMSAEEIDDDIAAEEDDNFFDDDELEEQL
jgi:transposase